jgi:heme oxygenase
MENSFRKKLYTATKKQHLLVEEVFDLRKKLNNSNLKLFYSALLIARSCCNEYLKDLEDNCLISTHNSVLTGALKQDVFLSEIDLNLAISRYRQEYFPLSDTSTQLGIFYVFAGSSAGAKVLLSMIKKEGIKISTEYFKTLVSHSAEQMNVLNELFLSQTFDEEQVIVSAQNTFKLIYNIASDGLRTRNTKVKGIRS